MIEITDEMVRAVLSAHGSDDEGSMPPVAEFLSFGGANNLGDIARAAIAAVAPLIAAAEREACAQIAERRTSEGVASAALALAGSDYMRGMTDTSDAIARAIRARGASCA